MVIIIINSKNGFCVNAQGAPLVVIIDSLSEPEGQQVALLRLCPSNHVTDQLAWPDVTPRPGSGQVPSLDRSSGRRRMIFKLISIFMLSCRRRGWRQWCQRRRRCRWRQPTTLPSSASAGSSPAVVFFFFLLRASRYTATTPKRPGVALLCRARFANWPSVIKIVQFLSISVYPSLQCPRKTGGRERSAFENRRHVGECD